jgi:hypothetical protein
MAAASMAAPEPGTPAAPNPGPLFRGVGVALVTLFDAGGEVDAVSTGKLAAGLAGRGLAAVLVNGTTGEAGALTGAERTALIEAVRAAVPDPVPVIAGTGAPSLRQADALTRAAVTAGADAVLTWCPPRCADLAGYFAAIGEAAAGRPVLAYHNPFIACADIPVDALAGLPVSGVKDSSGSPDRTSWPGTRATPSPAHPATWPWPARWARRVPCWPWPTWPPRPVSAPGAGTPRPSAAWRRSTWPSARAARRS